VGVGGFVFAGSVGLVVLVEEEEEEEEEEEMPTAACTTPIRLAMGRWKL
jgi:hypothetical protein